MSLQRVLIAVALTVPLAGLVNCNDPDPARVEPGDAVRCCFLVPYDGLAGSEQVEECMAKPVCAGAGHDDTEDVCDPLSCKSGDSAPYGQPGPSNTTVVTGNCTFDVVRTTVVHGACSGEAAAPG